METKMGVPEQAEIAFRRKIAYFCCMRKTFIILLAVVAVCGCRQGYKMECGQSFELATPWILNHDRGSESLTVSVPGTVAGALEEAGLLGENLLVGYNYAQADKSRFDDPWTYSTTLSVQPQEGRHYLLTFDGLNYYADIFFNGEQLASADTTFGVFIRREYDVTALMTGKDAIKVRLRRAQPGDLNIGFVDWNPRPLDESMGIVRPVTFHATGAIAIGDVFVVPELDVETLDKADLKVRVALRNLENRPVEGRLKLDLEGCGSCSVPVSLEAGEAREITLTPAEAPLLHLDHPRVWWSHDLGSPELYNLTASAEVKAGVSDKKEVVFGVRSIKSYLTEEGWRQFTLNGKDILIKGAGWTDDIFLRDTPETIERQVSYVKDMNLNTIRFENIWGKDDTVYELCDRMGILALVGWSCQWEWEDYCGLPEVDGYGCINGKEVEDLAVRYFHDQVVRLHNHPAVIGWMTGSDRIPNPGLEERYMEIYEKEDYRPYICSAKHLESTVTGWSGTKMEGPYEYVGPDYWYLDKDCGGAFGFNTETGIGANLPQLESLERMISAMDWWPITDSWDYHCTASSSAMNSTGMLRRVITAQYGPAKDLRDFVRKAHAVDYDGTRAMFEAFRVRMPLSTGIVQWMLNSAWPSLYWQLYDYYGAPTAGYFGTKKACEPQQLIYNYADDKVYAVSESLEPRALKAKVQVFSDQSVLMGEENADLMLEYRQSTPVFDLSQYAGKPHFVALTLTDTEGNPVADNFYSIPAARNQYDWSRANWYLTPITQYADMGFVFNQGQAAIQSHIEQEGDKYTVTLTNRSSVIAPLVIVKVVDEENRLVTPVLWSDNFVTLLPRQTRTLTCTTPASAPRFFIDY